LLCLREIIHPRKISLIGVIIQEEEYGRTTVSTPSSIVLTPREILKLQLPIFTFTNHNNHTASGNEGTSPRTINITGEEVLGWFVSRLNGQTNPPSPIPSSENMSASSSARPALTKRTSTRGINEKPAAAVRRPLEPEKMAEKINSLLLNDVITIENSIRVKEALKTANKAWLFQFLKMDGLQNLISMLLKFQSMDDKEPNELRIQYELLLCVKSAMNSQSGLDLMIGQPELVASLALNIDSEDSAICTQV
jgi:hypothetical protein